MILPISNNENKGYASFTKEERKTTRKKTEYDTDTLLENDFKTRTMIGVNKLGNALTLFPAKGLTGNKNSNFYEFLTMGIVPYLTGSLVMMSVFNSKNKIFAPFASAKAKEIGRKMALGVLLYGIFKELAKPLITKPVKWLTGIDTEVPYAKVIYELPDNIYDTDTTSIEHHKIFESKDFPRWDLLYKSEAKGETRNEYYDNVAKKLGYGENLTDSDQEMKPIIKEIAIKTAFAKIISSYLWAGVGVMLANQAPWDDYFKIATIKFWQLNKFLHSLKIFAKSAKKSAVELYTGPKLEKRFKRHAGKYMIGLATLSTIIGVINATHVKKLPENKNVIDKTGKVVVD